MATPPFGSGSRFRIALTIGLLLLGLFWPVNLAWSICGPVVPPQPNQPEFEPNDLPEMAQPMTLLPPVVGEMTPAGDSDFFLIVDLPAMEGLQLSIEADFWNPLLRLWGLGPFGFSVLAEVDDEPFCAPEQLVYGPDPCLNATPVDAYVVEVAHSPMEPPGMGAYALHAVPWPASVPQGDCCAWPLPAGALPWSDTRSSASPYRDQGFGSAPDVWYRIDLEQAGTLVAQTCNGASGFDTVLRLVDDDCQTVLASNDDSNVCGFGSSLSWLTWPLPAGTYYVVVEGAAGTSGSYTLDLSLAQDCLPVAIPDPHVPELEPNGDWTLAQPIPEWPAVHGEISDGDEDWFLLPVPSGAGVDVQLETDFFDGVLRIWGLEDGTPVLLAESDAGGVCEAEQAGFGATDPCLQLQHIDGVAVQVTTNQTLQPFAHYNMTTTVVASSVPAGDCCLHPLSVGSLPYSDTRSSASPYRDQGFGSAPDVWYRLTVDAATALTASTCGASTNFDTVLRLVDDDCQTVLQSNDDSPVCGSPSSTKSFFAACLDPGTYYVVVEGAGGASGTYDLQLRAASAGLNARLSVGSWLGDAEPWRRHFTAADTRLWLRPDDPCASVQLVDFAGSVDGGPWVPLGSDVDGTELRLATAHGPQPDGDGWGLDFEASQLPLPAEESVPVTFRADLLLEDGNVLVTTCESLWSPGLDPERSLAELPRISVIEDDTLWVPISIVQPPLIGEIRWLLDLKDLTWQRAVPSESQRGVSDTHCSPTAAAACLEWLDATYGTNVTGGWSGEMLTTLLGIYCETNWWGDGTWVSDLVSGLQDWIADHGGGYTVHSSSGSVEDMQDQGEAKGQDVIATLRWSDGGAHSVTLSSVHNMPYADGTVDMDFMDPWTGTTQWGNFDPSTGAFSGYGDGADSGTLGTTVYVCPVQASAGAPASARDRDSGTLEPVPGLAPIPVPVGLWWLQLTWIDVSGQAREDFFIVRRLPGPPAIRLRLEPDEGRLRLEWDPVPGATGYEIYRSAEPWFDVDDLDPWAVTTEPFFLETAPAGADLGFFRVRALLP